MPGLMRLRAIHGLEISLGKISKTRDFAPLLFHQWKTISIRKISMKNGRISTIPNSKKIPQIWGVTRCKPYLTVIIMITSLQPWLKIKPKFTQASNPKKVELELLRRMPTSSTTLSSCSSSSIIRYHSTSNSKWALSLRFISAPIWAASSSKMHRLGRRWSPPKALTPAKGRCLATLARNKR